MKKYFIFIICILSSAITINTYARVPLEQKLSGYILLQVESRGEAWYVNPSNFQRYYLNLPSDAFAVMRTLSTGITNVALNEIPIGLMNYDDVDNDNDGLTNRFERALGTDPETSDSDGDEFDDKVEIENGYNPNGEGKLAYDLDFTDSNKGKIFLAVEKNGEAWYINPADSKRYYLGRPSDAFLIMRTLSLGITNDNIAKIAITPTKEPSPSPPTPCSDCSTDQIFSAAAAAIRTGKKEVVLDYFIPTMHKALEHTMDILTKDQKFILGNIMAGATLSNSEENKKTYSTEVYFSLGGYKVPVNFYVEKQDDGTWKLTNL